MRKQLHFAHGNGFPSPCYRQLLMDLEGSFDCSYIDRVGHSSEYPVTDNWHHLVDELIDSIRTQSSGPVIGLGHSLGGVLNVLAAIEQPSLFDAIILLDSPLFGRVKSSLVRMSKALGVIDKITPASRTKKRRHHWKSRGDVLSYLKSRSLFKTFTDACLDDYIDFGMNKNEDGYTLRFDPKVEYHIYRTIPHILYEHQGRLKVPTILIYGSKSNVVGQMELRYMKQHYGIDHIVTKGTHMFPMEYPHEIAQLVIDLVG